MQATYTIPVPRYFEFESKIGAINKRAAKLGFEPIIYTVLSSEERSAGRDDYGRALFLTWYTVEVIGQTPKIAGWTFAATLDPLPDGNVIRSVPGAPETPERFRTAISTCDHCNVKRYRRDTFLIVSESGDWKQVGRSCVQDFLGVDPHAVAQWCSFLREIEALGDGDDDALGGAGSGYVGRSSVFSILAWGAAAIRQVGWVSRKVAQESYGKIATIDRLRSYWNARTETERRAYHLDAPNDDDRALAFATLQYWNAQTPFGDYEHNVKLVLSQGLIEPKQEGIAVSAVSALQRVLEKQREEAAIEERLATVPEWLGAIGERKTFPGVQVLSARVKEDEWSGAFKTTIKFMDQQGQILMWFASGHLLEAWPVGSVLDITGTIKHLDTFRERKQTVLSRVIVATPKIKKPRKNGAAQPAAQPVEGQPNVA